ncbi:MAG: glycine C-acetyltransferase [Gemmataceae bacterium]|nr:glycine C-acetyltransferase [Gemmataceae bacterium]
MSDAALRAVLKTQLADLQAQGLYKRERQIETPQGAVIRVAGREVINFCANNYLGLANNPEVVAAAHEGLKKFGYGLSSVRFICGTQTLHRDLEGEIAKFHGKDDTILYTSCFDANGGLFETILGEQDAVISDALNHASIIDGIRLCKAKRFRYQHADLADLERCLKEAEGCRLKLIATDSVFSMDGDLAPLPAICDLAERFGAAVMIDECHGTGHLGAGGRGAAEALGCLDRIDIITSTLGKTLGGSAGGFTTGPQEVVDFLRQRSRPYLFSNALTPSLAYASKTAIDLIHRSGDLRARLQENTKQLRGDLERAGFQVKPGQSPILPVMIGDAALAAKMADALLERGIYVIGFSFPVVPQGQARIRIQVSAAHTREHIDRAAKAFTEVGRELGII